MTGATTHAEHSPFIRQLLGDLADSVTPAPPPASYEDVARMWCVQGAEQMADDLELAARSFIVAVSLGSNDAMAWLGACLVDIAYIHDRFDDPEVRELAIEGLGWLDLGARCGATIADALFAKIQPAIPSSVIDEWASRPPGFHITIH